jgi:hypothetical protein
MAYTTIDDGSAYFQTAIYSGTGNGQQVTNDGNSNLQPDFIWAKRRDDLGYHQLIDSSRGGTKRLWSNDNGTEGTQNNVASFDSDGFTAGDSSDITPSSTTMVAWQWKANGGTTTSNGASGDIKASVTQREDTAKFAICTYTGTGINAGQSHRVNHGLGTTPHVMLFKSRGASGDWVVYHHKNTSSPETDYLVLNSTAATVDSANKFNDTAPNSSYATIGGDDNISSGTMLLYSFAEVQGYSKFGGYTGNGNANGPFIYTGFKPALVIIKETGSTGSWHIFDTKRRTFNVTNVVLYGDTNDAESTNNTGNPIDIVSNGFKCRGSGNDSNLDDGTYVYMAFAKHPFVSSEGVPVTAK